MTLTMSTDKRLMAAAREDNPDMLQEVLDSENFDINYQDGWVTTFCARYESDSMDRLQIREYR